MYWSRLTFLSTIFLPSQTRTAPSCQIGALTRGSDSCMPCADWMREDPPDGLRLQDPTTGCSTGSEWQGMFFIVLFYSLVPTPSKPVWVTRYHRDYQYTEVEDNVTLYNQETGSLLCLSITDNARVSFPKLQKICFLTYKRQAGGFGCICQGFEIQWNFFFFFCCVHSIKNYRIEFASHSHICMVFETKILIFTITKMM